MHYCHVRYPFRCFSDRRMLPDCAVPATAKGFLATPFPHRQPHLPGHRYYRLPQQQRHPGNGPAHRQHECRGDRDIRARHESIAKISSGLNHLGISSAGQAVWRLWVSAVNMGLMSGLTELSPPGADHRFRLLFFRHWRSRCFHIRFGMTLLSGNRTPAARKSLIMSRSSFSNCLGGR